MDIKESIYVMTQANHIVNSANMADEINGSRHSHWNVNYVNISNYDDLNSFCKVPYKRVKRVFERLFESGAVIQKSVIDLAEKVINIFSVSKNHGLENNAYFNAKGGTRIDLDRIQMTNISDQKSVISSLFSTPFILSNGQYPQGIENKLNATSGLSLEKGCDQEEIYVEKSRVKSKEDRLPMLPVVKKLLNNTCDPQDRVSKLRGELCELKELPNRVKEKVKTYALITGGALASIYCFHRAYQNLSALRKTKERRLGTICKTVAWIFVGTIGTGVSTFSLKKT